MPSKDLYNSHPRTHGRGGRTCRICANHGGMIRKYHLDMCRQCFKENAAAIGFVKYK